MPTMALETRARMRLPVSQPRLNSAMPAVRRQMPQGMSTEASMTARWYSMSIIIVCRVIPAKLRMMPQ